MATIRKSLTITEAQEQWIKLQIEMGGFASDSEYLRHLIRSDQERNKEFLSTRAAIEEGYDSGVSSKVRSVDQIMDAALIRRKKEDKGKSNG